MPLLFPTQGTLHDFLGPASLYGRKPADLEAPSPPRRAFPAWSAVDDVKNKAGKLSAEAQKEYKIASEKAQAKAGKIELYSAKYYAACTMGGILACVSHGVSVHCYLLISVRAQPTQQLRH